MDPDKKHIVAVTAMVKNRAGDVVLLLKRGAHEIAFHGKWAFPGGKAERGETLREAVIREVREEVVIELEDEIAYRGDYTLVRPDGHNVVGTRVSARARTEDMRIPSDFDAYAWVAPDALGKYDCIPGMDEEARAAFGRRARP